MQHGNPEKGLEVPEMARLTLHAGLTLLLAALLAASSGALAARPPNAGGGSGGGGSEGNETSDYGDLFVLYRDASGIPILTADDCQQPLAAAPFEGCLTTAVGDCLIIPVDPATCAVLPEYAILTQEVDFGRINEVRSPDSVFEAQLEDVLVKLGTAGCISLDPAGRLVASNFVEGDELLGEEDRVESATIDSPLQNLAIYQQLMREGQIGGGLPLYRDWMMTAASSLGAAADKTGGIGVDMVVYINQFLGLVEEGTTGQLARNCILVKQEVAGVIQHVQKCFLDYSGFTYNRHGNFQGLPHPAYLPVQNPMDGYFEYLWEFDPINHYFMINTGPILDAVPELLADTTLMLTNIGGFAKAADDTRAVIEYAHTWPVPGGYEVPVPCSVSADVFYDVSISDESGLQVPVRMVADTEGREGILTVANAGPAQATGRVILTAVDDAGMPIGPLYRIVDGVVTEEVVFATPQGEEFTLPAGYSASWSFFFSMDYATRITWTATVDAPQDVNPTNDTVTETTLVKKTNGGGGGEEEH